LRSFLLLGFLWGLVMLIRYQDGVLGVLAAPKLLREAADLRHRRRLQSLGRIALFGGTALAVMSVQFAFWQRVFGEPLVTALPIAMDWTRPHVLPFLLSTWAGAFLFSPLFAFGLAGLWLFPERSMRWALLAAVVLQVYVCACVSDWWGSASFGARRLVAIAPLAGLGVALLVDRFATSRRRTVIALATVGVAIVWNVRLAHYTVAGWFPNNARNTAAFLRDYPSGHPYRQPWAQWDYVRFAGEVADAERRMWRRR
jgi:hypothetical protein